MQSELYKRLEKLAFKKSIPFCYNDYIECPTGRCIECGSDDLMRLVPEFGCEYGTDWVIKYILENELESLNIEEAFEQFVRECYAEETTVGWMSFDTVTLMKENDPVSWRCAIADYESQEESEGTIVSFDGGANYYNLQEVEDYLDQEGV